MSLPGGGRITYLSSPHFVCAEGVEIWADSAEAYSAFGYSDLMGHVRYTDRQRVLRADNARYFSQEARLQAHGSVFVEDTVQGSIIRNGDLVYLRKASFRPQEEMIVTTGADGVRPHATLYMRPAEDTTALAGDTVNGLAADTVNGPEADTLAPAVEARADTGAAAADTARARRDTTFVDTEPTRVTVDTAGVRQAAAVRSDSSALRHDTATFRRDTGAARVDTTALRAALEPPAAPEAAADTVRRPYDVVADRIRLEGDQYFKAIGSVDIRRDSLQAHSDSAEYDQMAGSLLLQGRAHVQSDSYDLRADRIDIGVPGGAIRDVEATRQAVLLGRSLRLTSPLIHMFLKDGLLDRLVAVPLLRDSTEVAAGDSAEAVRPVAVAEKFHLTADSLEVNAPGQELRRIFASGDARGASDARDSLNVDSLPEVARRDWVEGDTVIVTFVPVPPDTASDSVAPPPPGQDTAQAQYRVDHLVAEGHARSLYRMLPSDSTARPGIDPPAIHYATGSRITIVMKEGEVDRMEVEGPTKGWHLEPLQRHAADTAASPDSLGARSDTAAARSDTSVAARAGTSRAAPTVAGPSHRDGRHPGGAADGGPRAWEPLARASREGRLR